MRTKIAGIMGRCDSYRNLRGFWQVPEAIMLAPVGHFGDRFEILGVILKISQALFDDIAIGNGKNGVRIDISEALNSKSSGTIVASGGTW